jgi:hypothetical protein
MSLWDDFAGKAPRIHSELIRAGFKFLRVIGDGRLIIDVAPAELLSQVMRLAATRQGQATAWLAVYGIDPHVIPVRVQHLVTFRAARRGDKDQDAVSASEFIASIEREWGANA